MVNKTKTILVVGGGKWQVPLIQNIKKLGHIVVNSNLYTDSEGFKFADFCYVADVLDKKKNLEIAIKHNIDAVLTDQSDIAVNTVAYINEKLGFETASIDIADLFTNKFRMRSEIQAPHLHHPKYRICNSISDIHDFHSEYSCTMILKPLANQSSRGVVLVEDLQQIEKYYRETIKHSKNGIFLVEEYIGGKEYTVEGFKFLNGTHHSFAISRKSHFNDICGVANSLLYLNDYKEFNIELLKSINNAIFSNLSYGITHVEYKYYNGKFYLIEAAIRGGGTKISSHIIPAVSGYNVNEMLIKTALGETVTFQENNYVVKPSVLKFLNFGTGKVSSISGINGFTDDSKVIDLELEFEVGDELHAPTDDRSRVGFFIASAKSEEELSHIINNIEKNITVRF